MLISTNVQISLLFIALSSLFGVFVGDAVISHGSGEQLGASVYAECLDRLEGRAVAWIRYILLARQNPFGFTLRKIYVDPCLLNILQSCIMLLEGTLMAHCARERERIALGSLDEVMQRLSRIFVEYKVVLPFSEARESLDGATAPWVAESKSLLACAT